MQVPTAHENFSSAPSDIDGSMSTLPLEITDHIIDMVALQRVKRVRSGLAACSLVCRSWTYRSRFHFFHDCRLLLHYHNAAAFGRLLRSPHCTILPHVRRLTMRNHGDCYTVFDDIKEDLKLLSRVETLRLSGSSWAVHGTAPRRGFMSSLADVVELEIDCAALGDFTHALLVICAFPRLEKLSLRQFSLGSRTAEESHHYSVLFPPYLPYSPPAWIRPNESLLRPAPLSSLSISAPALIPILHWFNWVGPQRVTRLELNLLRLLRREDTPPLLQYLRGVSPFLEDFKLISSRPPLLEDPDEDILTVFDLRPCGNLRIVHFEHPRQSDHLAPGARCIVSIVQSVVSPFLETVFFTLHDHRTLDRSLWSPLDTFFVKSDFPALQFVRFSVSTVFTDNLEELFPRMHAQGLLQQTILSIVFDVKENETDTSGSHRSSSVMG
ncbi:hypothetical protein C8R43DRAFT_997185 [Mycena crocata]|nr:hypothetical protein C8R43DRAFT_997185 [Mycena crocata]